MLEINTKIVKELISNQFPKWKHLSIKQVEQSGHDNRTFHLGNEMTIRLPSSEAYVDQVEKELKWLPILRQYITTQISSPIEKGHPDSCYPFPWSINRYIEGETVNHTNIDDIKQFAIDLADFLRELQSISTVDAPVAGQHNFFRGGDLSVYHNETEAVLSRLKCVLPTEDLSQIWQRAICSKWTKKGVWIHGDVAPGNLLVKCGRLCGVIDFGIMGVGDPSCDYAMAWTFFDKESRKEFLHGVDRDTVDRARGWALWKALITYKRENIGISNNAGSTIKSILDETI